MRKKIKKILIIGLLLSLITVCLGYLNASFSEKAFDSQSPHGILPPAPSKSMSQRAENLAQGTMEYSGSQSLKQGIPEPQSADMVGPEPLKKLDIPALGDKVIRTADLEIQVKKGKFDESFNRVLSLVKGIGGYATQSKSQATGDDIASGEITIRVPAQDFESALSSLKKIGKVKSVNVSGEDVSEEYVDLQSRLRNWQAQESVLLDLMSKAKSISESIMIQNNLSQVQMEIERLTGRLNFLENRTSYATIRLSIAEPLVLNHPDRWGFSTALENALETSMAVLRAVIVLTGYLLPLAILIAIGYAMYRIIIRKPTANATKV